MRFRAVRSNLSSAALARQRFQISPEEQIAETTGGGVNPVRVAYGAWSDRAANSKKRRREGEWPQKSEKNTTKGGGI